MKKFCVEDWKWVISFGVICIILELLLVLVVYRIGYIVGDTDATRQCIEAQKNRKY